MNQPSKQPLTGEKDRQVDPDLELAAWNGEAAGDENGARLAPGKRARAGASRHEPSLPGEARPRGLDVPAPGKRTLTEVAYRDEERGLHERLRADRDDALAEGSVDARAPIDPWHRLPRPDARAPRQAIAGVMDKVRRPAAGRAQRPPRRAQVETAAPRVAPRMPRAQRVARAARAARVRKKSEAMAPVRSLLRGLRSRSERAKMRPRVAGSAAATAARAVRAASPRPIEERSRAHRPEMERRGAAQAAAARHGNLAARPAEARPGPERVALALVAIQPLPRMDRREELRQPNLTLGGRGESAPVPKATPSSERLSGPASRRAPSPPARDTARGAADAAKNRITSRPAPVDEAPRRIARGTAPPTARAPRVELVRAPREGVVTSPVPVRAAVPAAKLEQPLPAGERPVVTAQLERVPTPSRWSDPVPIVPTREGRPVAARTATALPASPLEGLPASRPARAGEPLRSDAPATVSLEGDRREAHASLSAEVATGQAVRPMARAHMAAEVEPLSRVRQEVILAHDEPRRAAQLAHRDASHEVAAAGAEQQHGIMREPDGHEGEAARTPGAIARAGDEHRGLEQAPAPHGDVDDEVRELVAPRTHGEAHAPRRDRLEPLDVSWFGDQGGADAKRAARFASARQAAPARDINVTTDAAAELAASAETQRRSGAAAASVAPTTIAAPSRGGARPARPAGLRPEAPVLVGGEREHAERDPQGGAGADPDGARESDRFAAIAAIEDAAVGESNAQAPAAMKAAAEPVANEIAGGVASAHASAQRDLAAAGETARAQRDAIINEPPPITPAQIAADAAAARAPHEAAARAAEGQRDAEVASSRAAADAHKAAALSARDATVSGAQATYQGESTAAQSGFQTEQATAQSTMQSSQSAAQGKLSSDQSAANQEASTGRAQANTNAATQRSTAQSQNQAQQQQAQTQNQAQQQQAQTQSQAQQQQTQAQGDAQVQAKHQEQTTQTQQAQTEGQNKFNEHTQRGQQQYQAEMARGQQRAAARRQQGEQQAAAKRAEASNQKGGGNWLKKAAGWVKDRIGDLIAAAKAILDAAIAAAKAILDAARRAATALLEAARRAALAAVEWAKQKIQSIISAIASAIRSIISTIAAAIRAIVQTLANVLKALVAALTQVLAALVQALQVAFNAILDTLIAAVALIDQNLANKLQQATQGFRDAVNRALDKMQADIVAAGDRLQQRIQAAADRVKATVTAAETALNARVTAVERDLNARVEAAADRMAERVNQAFDRAQAAVDRVFDAAERVVEAWHEAAKVALDAVETAAKWAVDRAADYVQATLDAASEALAAVARAIPDSWKKAFVDFWNGPWRELIIIGLATVAALVITAVTLGTAAPFAAILLAALIGGTLAGGAYFAGETVARESVVDMQKDGQGIYVPGQGFVKPTVDPKTGLASFPVKGPDGNMVQVTIGPDGKMMLPPGTDPELAKKLDISQLDWALSNFNIGPGGEIDAKSLRERQDYAVAEGAKGFVEGFISAGMAQAGGAFGGMAASSLASRGASVVVQRGVNALANSGAMYLSGAAVPSAGVFVDTVAEGGSVSDAWKNARAVAGDSLTSPELIGATILTGGFMHFGPKFIEPRFTGKPAAAINTTAYVGTALTGSAGGGFVADTWNGLQDGEGWGDSLSDGWDRAKVNFTPEAIAANALPAVGGAFYGGPKARGPHGEAGGPGVEIAPGVHDPGGPVPARDTGGPVPVRDTGGPVPVRDEGGPTTSRPRDEGGLTTRPAEETTTSGKPKTEETTTSGKPKTEESATSTKAPTEEPATSAKPKTEDTASPTTEPTRTPEPSPTPDPIPNRTPDPITSTSTSTRTSTSTSTSTTHSAPTSEGRSSEPRIEGPLTKELDTLLADSGLDPSIRAQAEDVYRQLPEEARAQFDELLRLQSEDPPLVQGLEDWLVFATRSDAYLPDLAAELEAALHLTEQIRASSRPDRVVVLGSDSHAPVIDGNTARTFDLEIRNRDGSIERSVEVKVVRKPVVRPSDLNNQIRNAVEKITGRRGQGIPITRPDTLVISAELGGERAGRARPPNRSIVERMAPDGTYSRHYADDGSPVGRGGHSNALDTLIPKTLDGLETLQAAPELQRITILNRSTEPGAPGEVTYVRGPDGKWTRVPDAPEVVTHPPADGDVRVWPREGEADAPVPQRDAPDNRPARDEGGTTTTRPDVEIPLPPGTPPRPQPRPRSRWFRWRQRHDRLTAGELHQLDLEFRQQRDWDAAYGSPEARQLNANGRRTSDPSVIAGHDHVLVDTRPLTYEDAHALQRQMADNDHSGLRAHGIDLPPRYDTRANEWGVADLQGGGYGLVRGSADNVNPAAIPDVRGLVSHSHPNDRPHGAIPLHDYLNNFQNLTGLSGFPGDLMVRRNQTGQHVLDLPIQLLGFDAKGQPLLGSHPAMGPGEHAPGVRPPSIQIVLTDVPTVAGHSHGGSGRVRGFLENRLGLQQRGVDTQPIYTFNVQVRAGGRVLWEGTFARVFDPARGQILLHDPGSIYVSTGHGPERWLDAEATWNQRRLDRAGFGPRVGTADILEINAGQSGVLGHSLPTRTAAEDAARRLAAGDPKALADVGLAPPPGQGRLPTRHFGVGQLPDGSYVVVFGDWTGVDFARVGVPGLRPVSVAEPPRAPETPGEHPARHRLGDDDVAAFLPDPRHIELMRSRGLDEFAVVHPFGISRRGIVEPARPAADWTPDEIAPARLTVHSVFHEPRFVGYRPDGVPVYQVRVEVVSSRGHVRWSSDEVYVSPDRVDTTRPAIENRPGRTIATPVTDGTVLRSEPHVVAGRRLGGFDEGMAILTRLSRGDLSALDALGVRSPEGFDARSVAWGLARVHADGSYVIVRGDRDGVDWARIGGVEPIGRTTAAPTGTTLLGADAGGGVPLRDLLVGDAVDRPRVLPPPRDFRLVAEGGHQHYFVRTPYELLTDGRVVLARPGASGNELGFIILRAEQVGTLGDGPGAPPVYHGVVRTYVDGGYVSGDLDVWVVDAGEGRVVSPRPINGTVARPPAGPEAAQAAPIAPHAGESFTAHNTARAIAQVWLPIVVAAVDLAQDGDGRAQVRTAHALAPGDHALRDASDPAAVVPIHMQVSARPLGSTLEGSPVKEARVRLLAGGEVLEERMVVLVGGGRVLDAPPRMMRMTDVAALRAQPALSAIISQPMEAGHAAHLVSRLRANDAGALEDPRIAMAGLERSPWERTWGVVRVGDRHFVARGGQSGLAIEGAEVVERSRPVAEGSALARPLLLDEALASPDAHLLLPAANEEGVTHLPYVVREDGTVSNPEGAAPDHRRMLRVEVVRAAVAGHETAGGHSVERGEAWIEYRVGEGDEVLRRFRVDTRTDWTAEEERVVFVDELPAPETEPGTETGPDRHPDPETDLDPDPDLDHNHHHDHDHDRDHDRELRDEPTHPARPWRLARGTNPGIPVVPDEISAQAARHASMWPHAAEVAVPLDTLLRDPDRRAERAALLPAPEVLRDLASSSQEGARVTTGFELTHDRGVRPAQAGSGLPPVEIVVGRPREVGTVDGDPMRPVFAWQLRMPGVAAEAGGELLYTARDPVHGAAVDVDPVALRTMARDADLIDRHVNIPVGLPLDRAEASRAVAMLAGGDREGYRALGVEGDPRLEPHTVEWGVALLDDGRAAVVRGGKYGVSLPGRPLVESSRALDDDNLLLEPGRIDDLLRGPDRAMLAPSPDTGACGLERIRDRELLPFVVHLPYVHLGDGRIGNPQTGSATRLSFALTEVPERRTFGGQDVWTVTGEYRSGAETLWRGTYHLARPRYAEDLFLTFDLDDMEHRFGPED